MAVVTKFISGVDIVISFVKSAVSDLIAVFTSFSIRNKNRSLRTQHNTVSTYRLGLSKPPIVNSRPVELFYHSRPFKLLIQIVAIALVTIWTVKNYIQIFAHL